MQLKKGSETILFETLNKIIYFEHLNTTGRIGKLCIATLNKEVFWKAWKMIIFLTDLDLEPVYKFLIYKLFDYVSEETSATKFLVQLY